MREFIETAKAIADESRARALLALRTHELCVCQIIELLELAPSTVSKHMAILRQARLVESRKIGRWVYFRRADNEAAAHVRGALAWLDESAAATGDLEAVHARVEAILRMPLEQLCQPRSGCGPKGTQRTSPAASTETPR